MARRQVDVAVIIPDASPLLTLARIGRLDLIERINKHRRTPLEPLDSEARTKKLRSVWKRKLRP